MPRTRTPFHLLPHSGPFDPIGRGPWRSPVRFIEMDNGRGDEGRRGGAHGVQGPPSLMPALPRGMAAPQSRPGALVIPRMQIGGGNAGAPGTAVAELPKLPPAPVAVGSHAHRGGAESRPPTIDTSNVGRANAALLAPAEAEHDAAHARARSVGEGVSPSSIRRRRPSRGRLAQRSGGMEALTPAGACGAHAGPLLPRCGQALGPLNAAAPRPVPWLGNWLSPRPNGIPPLGSQRGRPSTTGWAGSCSTGCPASPASSSSSSPRPSTL